MSANASAHDAFRSARDFLVAERTDYAAAYARFRWPQLEEFNWALDWFDVIAHENSRPALRIVEEDGETSVSFKDLANRSNQVASWLRSRGIGRGHRVVIMLDNRVALWETLLALMKLGVVAVPLPRGISSTDVTDRVERSNARVVIAEYVDVEQFSGVGPGTVRVAVGGTAPGWEAYDDSYAASNQFAPDAVTLGSDPLMGYFTSGTSSRPKLVEHTHLSYPLGHLSSLYFNGVVPGDIHLNVSNPGWAKHSWSSVFVPWTAEATVVALNTAQPSDEIDVGLLVDVVQRCGVTSLCAPPRVWRALARADLGSGPVVLREATSAGGHLPDDVVAAIRERWNVTIRDGYGQTETTGQIGNTPGQPIKPGSVGRPLPGYRIVLVDEATGQVGDEGEICVVLTNEFPAMMSGYVGDSARTSSSIRGGLYRTGDVGRRDADGYITVEGRVDDMFKCLGHRVSPAEVESVLLAHPMVREGAVVGIPDDAAGSAPKAFVVASAGVTPNAAAAAAIFRYSRERLAPHARLRALAFVHSLPTTTSGKVRRAALRGDVGRVVLSEFREDDLPPRPEQAEATDTGPHRHTSQASSIQP